MDLGLVRICDLLSHLNYPHSRLDVIHIAGTNGKGSVSSYVDSILNMAGFKTGRFNSPHLLEPRDTIRVNGAAISAVEFQRASDFIAKVNAEREVGATSFELLTATALWWFDVQAVDVAIVEVGLGGRLDATNVFDSPLLSIITSIGVDHAALLGNTIEAIASEKAGIMKHGCGVVVAPQEENEAERTLREHATIIGCGSYVSVEAARWDTTRYTGWAKVRLLNNEEFEFQIPLLGDFQLSNAATAITAIDTLRKDNTKFESITNRHIGDGMLNTKWPGRLYWADISSVGINMPNSKILVDGAHNPSAARALRQFVEQQLMDAPDMSVHWIFGATRGKDLSAILASLLRPGDSLSAVGFSEVESMPFIRNIDPLDIIACVQKMDFGIFVHAVGSLEEALRSHNNHGMTVLCGSLYLVADLMRLLEVEIC